MDTGGQTRRVGFGGGVAGEGMLISTGVRSQIAGDSSKASRDAEGRWKDCRGQAAIERVAAMI